MIIWSETALEDLEQTVDYLLEFPEFVTHKFHKDLIALFDQIETNPHQFPIKHNSSTIHKAVFLKYNSIYFKIIDSDVLIIRFFSNRQNPADLGF